MKKIIMLLMLIFSLSLLSGCEKKEEEQATATETYVEENEVQLVYHDTENVDFRVIVIAGDMKTGFERLMADAKKGESANKYRFYEYTQFSYFRTLLANEAVEIATVPLEEALELYRENPELLCVLSINTEFEDGYGVTVATQKIARMYPFALQVFMEEMKYSAKDATCIVGDEMREMIEIYFEEQEEELPGDEFYYPLPELLDDEVMDVEETEEND